MLTTTFVPLVVADNAADFPGKSTLVSIYSRPANMIVAEKVPRAIACMFVHLFNEAHNAKS